MNGALLYQSQFHFLSPVGDYIVRAIGEGSAGLTLEEFHSVLLNSFNYVRADVLAEEIIQTGESK